MTNRDRVFFYFYVPSVIFCDQFNRMLARTDAFSVERPFPRHGAGTKRAGTGFAWQRVAIEPQPERPDPGAWRRCFAVRRFALQVKLSFVDHATGGQTGKRQIVWWGTVDFYFYMRFGTIVSFVQVILGQHVHIVFAIRKFFVICKCLVEFGRALHTFTLAFFI